MSRPTPGHAKMVSVMTAPPRSWPVSSPARVTMGMAAFLSVCLPTTTSSASPFARAVRMKSSPRMSSTDERVRRAMRAA